MLRSTHRVGLAIGGLIAGLVVASVPAAGRSARSAPGTYVGTTSQGLQVRITLSRDGRTGHWSIHYGARCADHLRYTGFAHSDRTGATDPPAAVRTNGTFRLKNTTTASGETLAYVIKGRFSGSKVTGAWQSTASGRSGGHTLHRCGSGRVSFTARLARRG
jgi:hypothetical protein